MKHLRNAFVLGLVGTGENIPLLPTIILLTFAIIELKKYFKKEEQQ